jgi:pyruvate/2-oxoglutarate dehydrogenase complex dihydrolipoamide acyltransferase (E2) component
MAYEVIMPALGMAQDTGKLVAWHKQIGDAVVSTDVLMEVETDKTTMEVDAGADGIILEMLVAAGDNVPVGNVVAVIGSAGETTTIETAVSEDLKTAAATEETTQQEIQVDNGVETVSVPEVPSPSPSPSMPMLPTVSSVAISGRILASPKARVMATENNIDLVQLRQSGASEPFHVADIDTFMASGVATMSAQTSFGGGVLQAEINADAFTNLLTQLSMEDDGVLVIAAFVAGAMRQMRDDVTAYIQLNLVDSQGNVQTVGNPDLGGLTLVADRVNSDNGEVQADLIIHDLRATRLSGAIPVPGLVPELWVMEKTVQHGNLLSLSLTYGAKHMSSPQAIALLDGLARRIEMPITHLL